MMNTEAIILSNSRAVTAIYAIKIFGVTPELITELRDGLRQRAQLRANFNAISKTMHTDNQSEICAYMR